MDLLTNEAEEIIAHQEMITRLRYRIEEILKNYRPVMNGEIYLSGEDVCRLLHISKRTLQQYRDDYQQQWINKGQIGVSGQWLMNYQRFLSQLEVAIEQQQKSLAWHEGNVSVSQAAWQQAYARLEGLRKLVQRYREEAQKSADKQEQKLLDEMAQRLMLRAASLD